MVLTIQTRGNAASHLLLDDILSVVPLSRALGLLLKGFIVRARGLEVYHGDLLGRGFEGLGFSCLDYRGWGVCCFEISGFRVLKLKGTKV